MNSVEDIQKAAEQIAGKSWTEAPRVKDIKNYMINVQIMHKHHNPFIYDKNGTFWLWNSNLCKYEIVDETDMLIALNEHLELNGQLVSRGYINGYLQACKQYGRMKLVQNQSKTTIQFRDRIFNIETKEVYPAGPDEFITNPIPWKLGKSTETPSIDKLFTEWVGEEDKQKLYEICAYCCLPDYPIQIIICLVGSGRNGKSLFQQFLTRLVGQSNVCSTELDSLIMSRFESSKLYKKLVCLMGETNFGSLNKTSLLKKLCGGDLVSFEHKNQKPFEDYNYAKIIISSNGLPSSQDTTEGYYRRFVVVRFPNEFPEGQNPLSKIPDEEYENLCNRITIALPKLLARGQFTGQGTIQERQHQYMLASNPLPIFLDSFCGKEDENAFVSYSKLYTSYIMYLKSLKMRKVSRKEFSGALDEEGLIVTKTSKKVGDEFVNGYWVEGIKLNNFAGCDKTFISTGTQHISQKAQNESVETQEEALYSQCDTSSLFLTRGRIGSREVDSREIEEVLSPVTIHLKVLQTILGKDINGKPAEVEIQELIKFGIPEEVLNKAKSESLAFEPRSGFLRRL